MQRDQKDWSGVAHCSPKADDAPAGSPEIEAESLSPEP